MLIGDRDRDFGGKAERRARNRDRRAAGAFSGDKKDNGGGGMTGKMTPCAVLVIQNGTTKLVNVKNQDGLTKILDMVPDFVDRFASGKGEEA